MILFIKVDHGWAEYPASSDKWFYEPIEGVLASIDVGSIAQINKLRRFENIP